jgi:DNA-binding transcriptional ArsR family regulator
MPTEPEHAGTTSEPERIRALAHPLRLRLLDVLDDEGTATATRCAELTGESVASCSFHLHMLAKYGYVEPGERRGRERPWQARGTARQSRYDPELPDSLPAVTATAHVVVEREADRLHRWLESAAHEMPEWLQASDVLTSSFWLTADEMADLAAELGRITDRFAGRSDDPDLRQPGARRARLFATLNAEPVGPRRPERTTPPPHPAPSGRTAS